ncbi:MAG: FAD:protein FMN transferase [Actinomycetes bacterium]
MTVFAPTTAWSKNAFAAMGTQVSTSLMTNTPAVADREVEDLFAAVERSCSRFDPASDLMRVNSQPSKPHVVSRQCAEVVQAAFDAYLETAGLFDPRILEALVGAGYDRTFDEVPQDVGDRTTASSCTPRTTWRPEIDPGTGSVTVGPSPIDLGGIGKGWTVDAAARLLADHSANFLINAGGDLTVRGGGPSGDGWTAAVEDPSDLTLSIAVLRLSDASCATSSTGRRKWRVGSQLRHHLIDPRTGEPAAGGIRSVTVIAPTTATAETWSKALLIAGSEVIEQLTESRRLAAYWVLDDGTTRASSAMETFVVWERNPR